MENNLNAVASNPTTDQPAEEEKEVQKVFNMFDANGDGKISLTELADIINGLGSSNEEEVERMMAELDTDGDGFIDLYEFRAFHSDDKDNMNNSNKELKEAFDLYDKDKNGKITANELLSVLRSLGEKCSLRDCRRMISSVDVDGDGCVNLEEFKKMMKKGS